MSHKCKAIKAEAEALDQVIAFLSAPLSKKIEIINQLPFQGDYKIDEFHSNALLPANAILIACLRLIRRDSYLIADEKCHQLLQEIGSIIEMTITIGQEIIGYHLMLEKRGSVPTGPFDDVWDVLFRLANDPIFNKDYRFDSVHRLLNSANIEFVGVSDED